MKPLFLALSLLAMSVTAHSAHAQSASDPLYSITGLSTGSVLNVRQGPGTSHTVVAKLTADTSGLRVLDCTATGGWCQIDDGQDIKGWVAAQYLEGSPSSTPAWRSQFTTEIPYRVTGISAGSSLNMRAGPGTENAVITKLPAGQSGLMILDCTDAGDWCKVGIGSSTPGWVASRFLSGIADASAKPAKPRNREAIRLASVTGITIKPGETTTIPELPPYLLGNWDVDRTACARDDSPSRVVVQPNGLRVGASNARFKNAIFQDEGYDLIALLMETQVAQTTIPQRALYRLEPRGDMLAVSGDVLTVQTLKRCVE